jgi:hypothetical protein
MAPERLQELRFLRLRIGLVSTESDVYSLAMTSFEVRSSAVNCLLLDTSPCYEQVLTGVLPYGESDTVIDDVICGKRPSRPTEPSQNRWLQRRVWVTISTCWNNEPAYRCELSTVHRVFSAPSAQAAQNTKSDKQGDLYAQKSRNLAIAERNQTPRQGYGSVPIFSHGLPLSSNFCAIRSQKSRDLSMKWTRQIFPPSSPPVPWLT